MKQKIGEFLRINIGVPFWSVLSVGVITLCSFYFFLPQYREQIKFVSAMLGCGAAIYSAYHIGTALRIGIDRERQKASFEILDIFNRPEYVEVRKFLDNAVKSHEIISANELYEKIVSNNELNNAVVTVLGILEDVSIAVQRGYVDEDILYLSLLSIVNRNYHFLKGYIDLVRKNDNRAGLFCEFEKLAQSWDSHKRLSDGMQLPIFK